MTKQRESFDLARALLPSQRPKCSLCGEMMIVPPKPPLRWSCVRVGRCRGTLALDEAKFRRWAAQHGVEIPGPPRLREGVKWNPPQRCPICDARMALRHNKAQRSEFWGCTRFPDCNGTRGPRSEF